MHEYAIYFRVLTVGNVGGYLTNFYKLDSKEGSKSEFAFVYKKKIKHQGKDGNFERLTDALDYLLGNSEPSTLLSNKEQFESSSYSKYWCQVAVAHTFRFPALLSYAFPKKSPYLEFFNYGQLKLKEKGVIDLIGKKYLEITTTCIGDQQTKKALSLVKLTSLFSIVALGIAVSVITFILEWLWKRPHLINDNHKGQSFEDKLECRDEELREAYISMGFKWGISDQESFIADLNNIFERQMALKSTV